MRACRTCHKPFEPAAFQARKGNWQCLPCRNAYERALVAKKRGTPPRVFLTAEEHYRRMLIRVSTRDAVRRGKLTKLPCEVCQAAPAEAHHDDYSKPFEVRWLCRHHHRQHHLSVEARSA